jgi:hypothetical protein
MSVWKAKQSEHRFNTRRKKAKTVKAQAKRRQTAATKASSGRVLGRNIPGPSPQVPCGTELGTQVSFFPGLAFLWLLVVVGGLWGILGIGFSTISAHPAKPPGDLFAADSPIGSLRRVGRRQDGSPADPAAEIALDANGLPAAGAATEEVASKSHQWWIDAAAKAGIDLTGFDPAAPLLARIAWAEQASLDIATVLSRYSSKIQHSTEAQVQHNVEYAAWHRFYPPPEFVCVDEAVKGRRVRRDGLDRVEAILSARKAKVLQSLRRPIRFFPLKLRFNDSNSSACRSNRFSQGVTAALPGPLKAFFNLCVNDPAM